MSYKITDKGLILDIVGEFSELAQIEMDKFKGVEFAHPLDMEIIEILRSLIPVKDLIEYSCISTLGKLWNKLVKKSIMCLRFLDMREPFFEDNNKIPMAYGVDRLEKYHERYIDFEGLLYGANTYYRDHVFHAVRTWMLGIFCLLKSINSQEKFIEFINIDGIDKQEFILKTDFFEKISMWTIIALCHDLGYPLEKSHQILDKTKEMMKEFIQNPNITSNFNFSGTQDSINEYIVKFISTKMKDIEVGSAAEERLYFGRIQPKYYLKYAKSLEKFDHGMISSVIVYKMLLFFIESDFNLNDDYKYAFYDARQFYIRREILRAMSSHTCDDIYNIHLTTFSSLLFLCDEFQEWGRKSWNAMYTGLAGLASDSIVLTIENFSEHEVRIREKIDMTDISEQEILDEVKQNIIRIFKRQYLRYKLVFRDGQYSKCRRFDFYKHIIINLKENGTNVNNISVSFCMKSEGKNFFKIDLSSTTSVFEKEIKKTITKTINDSEYKHEVQIV